MVDIICGERGQGKTKEMLQRANDSVADAKGSIVYIDKSPPHIYELNNQVRLINISEYPVESYEGFIGFVSGLLAGNYGIECVFIDSLIKVALLEEGMISELVETLDKLSKDIKFVCSVSMQEDLLPDELKKKIIVSC